MTSTLDRDLTLGDLVLLLWRRRALVIALTLLGGIAAAAASWASPTRFRASAQVVLTGVLYVNTAPTAADAEPVPAFVVRPAPLDRAVMAAIANGPAVLRPVRRGDGADDYRFDAETAGDQLVKLNVMGPDPAKASALALQWAEALRDVLAGLYEPDAPIQAAPAAPPTAVATTTYHLSWPIRILADPEPARNPVRRSLKRDALLGLLAGAAFSIFLALSFAPRPRPGN
jgi:capsular polysaccharide biosynthesis protein